jgi:hypothetical protein
MNFTLKKNPTIARDTPKKSLNKEGKTYHP